MGMVGKSRKCPLFLGSPQAPQLCQRQRQEARGENRDGGGSQTRLGILFHTESTETRGLKSFFMNVSSGPKGLVEAMLTGQVPGLTYRPQPAVLRIFLGGDETVISFQEGSSLPENS